MEKTEKAGSTEPGTVSIGQQFDLLAVVDTFCCWYRQALADRNLQLTTKISPQLPRYFLGNEILTRHVLYQPAKNSFLYLGSGEVLLEIAAEQLAGRRYALSCNLTLAGRGVPPAREKELFQPYPGHARQSIRDGFRLRCANLYYARIIARLLGGDLRLDTRAGSGTRYRLEIRLLAGLG
jgi:signal transduction histidine kinase